MKPNLSILDRIIATLFTSKKKLGGGNSLAQRRRRLTGLLSTMLVGFGLWMGTGSDIQAQTWSGGHAASTAPTHGAVPVGWWSIVYVANTAYDGTKEMTGTNYPFVGYDAWGNTYYSGTNLGTTKVGGNVFVNGNNVTFTDAAYNKNVNINGSSHGETTTSVTNMTMTGGAWNFTGDALSGDTLALSGSGTLSLNGGDFSFGGVTFNGTGGTWTVGGAQTLRGGTSIDLSGSGTFIANTTVTASNMRITGTNWAVGGNTSITGGLVLDIDLSGTLDLTNELLFGTANGSGGGINFRNGTIQARVSDPLGAYVYNSNKPTESLVRVYGHTTLQTSLSGSSFANRFEINNGTSLTFSITEDQKLVIHDVDTRLAADDVMKGGAFFIRAGGSIGHRAGSRGTLVFQDNKAKLGAAVYAVQDYTVDGLTLFTGNVATVAGGAIYMEGSRSKNTLTIDSALGDIAFVNNTIDDGVNPAKKNSIYLLQNIDVVMQGQYYTFFDDGILSEVNVEDSKGHTLTVNITDHGFVQFGNESNSILTHLGKSGGRVDLNSGIFRVAGDVVGGNVTAASKQGVFETLGGSSVFNVQAGATLAGGGIIAAGQGFYISGGALSPDAYSFLIPADLKHTGEWNPTTNIMGDLTLKGNVYYTGGSYDVDTASVASMRTDNNLYQLSDTVIIKELDSDTLEQTGKLVATSGGVSSINVSTWTPDNINKYIIFAAQNGVDVTDKTVMDYFKITSSGGGELKGRKGASLVVRDKLTQKGALDWEDEQDIVLYTSDDANIYLVWDGTNTNRWNDDTSEDPEKMNWYRRGSAADMAKMKSIAIADTSSMEQAYFKKGDYLFFGDAAKEKQVVLEDDWVVSGMEILGGNYTFSGLYNIEGRIANGADPFIGVVATGKLVVDGYNNGGAATTVTFYNTTDFDQGTDLSNNATVTIYDATALGVYDENQNDGDLYAKGVVRVVSRETVPGQTAPPSTATIATPINLAGVDAVTQHYEIENGNKLIFALGSGLEYEIKGVQTYNYTPVNPGPVDFESLYKGGAMYIGVGASYEKTGDDTILRFTENRANYGGAIYADQDLTVTGNTAFIGNKAVEDLANGGGLGGAIFMEARSNAKLLFDTDAGNIVFAQNLAGVDPENVGTTGVANSVHLSMVTNMSFTGTNNVLFNDPISSGVTAGGNTLTTAVYVPATDDDPASGFDGIIQFMDVNRLNDSNIVTEAIVDLQGGTLRLAGNNAEFHVGGQKVTSNHFTVGTQATLAGAGEFIAPAGGKGFIINGTISPDSDTFTSELVGGGAVDKFTVTAGQEIGTLTFDGKMLLDAATLEIDLGAPGANGNDLINVTGDVTLNNVTTIVASALATFNNTDRKILDAATILNAAGVAAIDDTTAKAMVDQYFTLDLTERQTGTLKIQADGGVYGELWIVGFSDDNNMKVYWTGATASTVNTGYGDWDIKTTENWTDVNRNDALKFVTNDYVIFDQTYLTGDEETDVYLTGAMTTIGVQIDSGSYTFGGIGTINGIAGQLNEVDEKGDPVVNNYAGKLLVNGGVATIGVATDFESGAEMNGGRINIAHKDALGVYDHAVAAIYAFDKDTGIVTGDRSGYINVAANGTIGTVFDNAAVGAVNDYTVTNRFVVATPTAPATTNTLTFDIANGTTLTINDVTTDAATNGGAIFVDTGASLTKTGTGTIALTNNTANNGGAIYAAGALTLTGDWDFGTDVTGIVPPVVRNGNTALNDGGAIYAANNLTINGTADFVGNWAGQNGGAINAVESVTLNGLTSFEFNTANAGSGGAINAKNVTINAASEFGGATKLTQRNYAEVNGGAINATEAVLLNAAMTFENNEAKTGSGGAINAGTTVTISKNVNFGSVDRTDPDNPVIANGNIAGAAGGAINADGGVTIAAGTTVGFYGNKAGTDGGAINAGDRVAETMADVIINGLAVTFEANEAVLAGGAITAKNVTVNATETTFTNNKTTGAGGHGGAILATDSVSINGTATFTGNNAAIAGGAINAANGTTVVGGTAIFDTNTAGIGGAINAGGAVTINGANSEFTENKALAGSGGAINSGGAVTIGKTTTFTDNTANLSGGAINAVGVVTINAETTFDGNTAKGDGGAIRANDGIDPVVGNVVINAKTTFTGNEAVDRTIDPADAGGSGGAISADGDVTIAANATATNFSDNVAYINGGAIDADGKVTISANTVFGFIDDTDPLAPINHGNKALRGAGGAINANDFEITAGTVSFTVNEAATTGGAINSTTNVKLGGLVTDFTGNVAGTGGGAINAGGTVTIGGTTTFTDNVTTTGHGGAIQATGDVTIAGTKTTFTDNHAQDAAGAGGAINTTAGVTIGGTTVFTENTAGSVGGAINANGKVTITGNTTFTDNHATVIGGAINVLGGLETEINGVTTFTENTAGAGGAIHTTGNVAIGAKATFTDNEATANMGGAIAATAVGNTVTIGVGAADSAFTGNAAEGHGGAIFAAGDVTINAKTLFEENESLTGSGGAIFTNGNVAIDSLGTQFLENTAKLSGGAINAATGSVTITANADADVATVFTENEAQGGSGGAINARDAVTLNGSVTFTDNEATVKGGAISSLGDVTVAGETNIFTGNEATAIGVGLGGAIFAGGNVAISGKTLFLDNEATFNGGAIYMDGGVNNVDMATLTLESDGKHIIFDGNTAANAGGAIYAAQFTDIVLAGDSDIFFGKTDTIFAGANSMFTMDMDDATDRVIMNANATITDGVAAINSGMLFLAGEVVDDQNTIIQDQVTFTADTFTLADGAELSGGGNVTAANGIEIAGTLDANSYLYTYDQGADTILVNKDNNIGTLTFDGNTTFDEATLQVDLKADTSADPTVYLSDHYVVTGDLTTNAASQNKINITQYADGTFDVIFANNVIDVDSFYVDASQTGARNTAELQLKDGDDTILQLVTSSTGKINGLLWTGNNNGNVDNEWFHLDTTKQNWITEFSNDGERQYFMNGDSVIFTDDVDYVKTKNVNLTSNVIVSGMEVFEANYTFDGDYTITGNIDGVDNANLLIGTAGTVTTATFNVGVNFDGDVVITDSTVAFKKGVTVGNDLIVDPSTLTVEGTTDVGNNYVIDESDATHDGDLIVGGNLLVNQAVDAESDLFKVSGTTEITGFAKISNVDEVEFGVLNVIGSDGGTGLAVDNVGDFLVKGDAVIKHHTIFTNVGDVTFKGDLTIENGGVSSLIVTTGDSFTVEGETFIQGFAMLNEVTDMSFGNLKVTTNLDVNTIAGVSTSFTAADTNIGGTATLKNIETVQFGDLTITGSDDPVTPDNGLGLIVDEVETFTVSGDAQINHHAVLTNVGDVLFEENLSIGNGATSSLIVGIADSFTVDGETHIKGLMTLNGVTEMTFNDDLDVTLTLEVNATGADSFFAVNGDTTVGMTATLNDVADMTFDGNLNAATLNVNTLAGTQSDSLTVTGNTIVGNVATFNNVADMTFEGNLNAGILNVNTLLGTQSDTLMVEGSATIAGATTIQNVGLATFEKDSTFTGGMDITASSVTLNGANTNAVGTTMNGVSTITLGNDGALGLADLNVAAGADATLKSNGPVREIGNDINIAATGKLTIDTENNGDVFTYNGDMTGGGDFTKAGAGTLIVSSADNEIGGDLVVADGTLKLLEDAVFEANTVTVNKGGTVTGDGKLTAGMFNLSGTISAGNVIKDIDGKVIGHDFGTLDLNGNVTFNNGAVIDLYVAVGNMSNTINVTGEVGFEANSKQTINVADEWVKGTYTVIDTTDGFLEAKDDVINQFNLSYKGSAFSKRQQAHVDLTADENDLILTVKEMKRYDLVWKGSESKEWNTSTENWIDPNDKIAFMDGDYVTFNDSAKEFIVNINPVGYTVSGMKIDTTSKSYTFNDGTITGKKVAAGTEGYEDVTNTGILEIASTAGSVTINNTMSFQNGIELTGGGALNVILGNDTALGKTGSNNEGYVTITGNKAVTFTEKVDGAINLQNRFVSNGGSMTFANGNWNFTNDKSNNTKRAEIIVSAGNVSINGSATFVNQSTGARDGWAINMDTGTNLTLNASTGDFEFSGSNKAAVLLNGGNTMTLTGDNDFDFQNGIYGTGVTTFVKNGNGNLNLYGTNTIGTSGSIDINDNGTLNMAEGSLLGIGSGTFKLNGATLVSNGNSIITANGGINLKGIVDVRENSDGTFGGLSLNGDTTFNNVKYMVQWDDEDNSSSIDVAGTVTFGGKNILSLDGSVWNNGTYDLVYASDDMNDSSSWSIYFGDKLIDSSGRKKASLDTVEIGGEYVLQLTTTGESIGLTWTNTEGDRVWDSLSVNWKDDNNRDETFIKGDAVLFDGRGNGAVKVANGGVTVSDMTITGGTYSFVGLAANSKITGSTTGTSMQDATGSLTILGGDVSFDLATNFAGNILISGSQTNVTLTENGKLQADGTFKLAENSTLELVPTTGSIKGSSVILAGNVVQERPDLDTPTSINDIASVIESTDTKLDTARLSDIFDVSYGLIDQNATFSSDQKVMDLTYTSLTPHEFSVKHGLSTNEKNVAGAISDIFGGKDVPANMDSLRDHLYNLRTANEVINVIDQMRGSEMYADALTLALWSPWQKVFRQLDRSDCCINGHYLGQKPTKINSREFWFEGYYQHSETSSDGNARSYEENRGGLMIGMDSKLSFDAVIGLTFGYGNPRLKHRFGKVESDDFTLALYGRKRVSSNSYMNAFIGFGGQDNQAERYETALGQKYNAKYDSYSLYASLEWIRPVKLDKIKLLPLVALDYQSAWRSSFDEKGGAFAQNVKKSDMDSLVARIGLNSTLFTTQKASLRTRLQYGYMFGGDEYGSIKSAFASNPSGPFMNLRGVNNGRNRLNVGIGGEFLLKETRFFMDYDFDCSDHTDAHTGQIGFNIFW